MCAETDAVEKRLQAALRLSEVLSSNRTAVALAAAVPLKRAIPYDMAVMLCELDRKEQEQ